MSSPRGAAPTGPVVVPLDGTPASERAIALAQALAARLACPVVLVRAAADDREAAARYLDGMIELHDLGPTARAEVLGRDPAGGLGDLVAHADGAVVCLASHGRSGVGHALFGSVAEEVLAQGAGPVFVVGPQHGADALDGARMGWCVDDRTDVDALAPFCAGWATRLGLGVDVLTMAPEDDRPISRFHPAPWELLDAAVERLEAQGVPAAAHVLRELQPARELARFAERRQLALLVAQTRPSSALARDLLGSSTMDLVHQAHCPVLVPPREVARSVTAGGSVR